ncbi:MAG: MBL fold metallo-hydrolase [Candidatus Nanopelagicales bacterium]|jgi:glyoxylase-like metal-dependent hydrolase (beta-lactamase superfamily II)/rhodanese-related sulfurtransferase|nr:MBL fold metallo-hydrolase [Candidatus Nanopelagicales bacterium]
MSARPTVVALDTPNLGDRSYLVALEGSAVVVDPQRDIDRILAIVEQNGWTVTHVVETHVHNDYVSGGLVLADELGAQYCVPRGHDYRFAATEVGDGTSFESGRMRWRVLHTPGHTPHHVSYAVAVDGTDAGVFTGGSMLYGSVGRPDLIGPHATEGLAHAQWHSMRRIVDEVAADADVYPTHGFGSFCSATNTVGTASTVGQQALSNPALLADEDTFVKGLIDGLDAFPAYYAHMGPANELGAGPIDLSLPARAEPVELRRRIDAGEWVIDLRSRVLFGQGHVRGTLSFPADGNAVTYLGWVIPWGTPLTLLGETAQQVQDFQRELVRIGIDRPEAHATGQPTDWALDPADVEQTPRTDFAGLVAALQADPNLLYVDARRRSEWTDGHVEGARLVPLHELPARVEEIVTWSRAAAHAGGDPRVWVSCGSGFRASIATSLLARAGVPVVHVDDMFANAARAGARIVVDQHPDTLGTAYTD